MARTRLLVVISLYAVAVIVELVIVLLHTHGQQIYVVDDSYIHAAIARNLVQHHVYGPTPYGTAFASSSILWPFLVAGVFFVVGVHAWVAFALNLLFGLLCLLAGDGLLDALAPKMNSSLRFAALLTLTFGTSLLAMAFLGMEHLLHLAAVLLLLQAYVRFMRAPSFDHQLLGRRLILLCLLAALATSVRYESLLMVFALCLALLKHRRIWSSALVGAAGFLPVVLFGLYVKSRIGDFLPNSVTVKSADRVGFLLEAWNNFRSNAGLVGNVTLSFVLASVLLIVVLIVRRKDEDQALSIETLTIILFTLFLHAGLGKFGWFYRYEVYLLGSLTIALFAVCYSAWNLRSVRVILMLFIVGMTVRGGLATFLVPRCALGIYEQQYQTGRFLARYYAGHNVALNDVGAPTFLSDLNVLDFWGLASPSVAKLIATNSVDRPHIAAIAGQVEVAVLFPYTFHYLAPADWIPVATMTVTNVPKHSSLLYNQVEFYADNPEAAKTLRQHLESFEPDLPTGVRLDLVR